jgi:hypothetical protein
VVFENTSTRKRAGAALERAEPWPDQDTASIATNVARTIAAINATRRPTCVP